MVTTEHRPESESERVAELQEDFRYADEDQDGYIDFAEFVVFLDGLGAEMSETEVRIGFAEIDADHDGRITLDEFAAWWLQD